MAKPSFLSPGSIVRTTYAINPQERNALGYVRNGRTDLNAGQVDVTLLDGLFKGSSLLFNVESLTSAE